MAELLRAAWIRQEPLTDPSDSVRIVVPRAPAAVGIEATRPKPYYPGRSPLL